MAERPGLLFRSGEPFATGVARYWDAFPGIPEPLPRIYVKLLLEGSAISVLALLDTGGHYLVLNQELAESIEPTLTESLGSRTLRTALGTVRGDIYSHRATFIAEDGDHLDVELTLFISPDWRGSCILGYSGALERLQFAVSPRTNHLYFGAF